MSGVLNYRDWAPGVIRGERLLGAVKETMPAISADDVPAVIRLLENPTSPWALPGAISLFRHDCLHVLLGRGLTGVDEGFVLGFTTGASRGRENAMTDLLRSIARGDQLYAGVVIEGVPIGEIALAARNTLMSDGRAMPITAEQNDRLLRDLQIAVFEAVATTVYQPPYRLTDAGLLAFRLGLNLGERNAVRDLEDFPFEEHLRDSVASLRTRLGIDALQLKAAFRLEIVYTNTREARRLDVDPGGVDHSRLRSVDAPASDWVKEKQLNAA